MPLTAQDRAQKALDAAQKDVDRAAKTLDQAQESLDKANRIQAAAQEKRDAAQAEHAEQKRLRDYAAQHPALRQEDNVVVDDAVEVSGADHEEPRPANDVTAPL